MASTGAFIAAEEEIINYLKYNMRSQMFAKSLQMQLVEGALKRLDMFNGFMNATSAVTGFRISPNSGNLQSGVITLYGLDQS